MESTPDVVKGLLCFGAIGDAVVVTEGELVNSEQETVIFSTPFSTPVSGREWVVGVAVTSCKEKATAPRKLSVVFSL